MCSNNLAYDIAEEIKQALDQDTRFQNTLRRLRANPDLVAVASRDPDLIASIQFALDSGEKRKTIVRRTVAGVRRAFSVLLAEALRLVSEEKTRQSRLEYRALN